MPNRSIAINKPYEIRRFKELKNDEHVIVFQKMGDTIYANSYIGTVHDVKRFKYYDLENSYTHFILLVEPKNMK